MIFIIYAILTNSKKFVTEINVSPDNYLCKSDHYLLTFVVKSNVKHNKVPKRKILSLKKANWEVLNNELGNKHWDAILDCMEPKLAWLAFKHTLFSLVDRYIPSISIKYDFKSPWFNAECFEAYIGTRIEPIKNSKIILGLKEILRIFSKVK